MIFFPFRSKTYKTGLSFDEVLSKLQAGTRAVSRDQDSGEKAEKSSTLEMTQEQSSFVISKGTGAKKPGLMDTAPVVKGKLEKGNGFTSVKITIGPRNFLLPVIG